ncbi:anion permease [Corynebacterium aquatimens]|uniref:anion permease n=1 Tax=Corynebacterium aquatimens TaxID=1190508 RepID=UPI00331421F1|nr:anion permease [Corynebacterium aquatimens]
MARRFGQLGGHGCAGDPRRAEPNRLRHGERHPHSAAANLLLPLAVSLALSLDGIDPLVVAAVVAIACSLGMSLPISTPPNAIAYATKEISIPQMAIVGLVVGTVATLLLIFALPSVWQLMGLVS